MTAKRATPRRPTTARKPAEVAAEPSRSRAKPARPARAASAGKPQTEARTARSKTKASARSKAKATVAAESKARAKAKPKGKARTAAGARPRLQQVVLDALTDMKAVDVRVIDVRGLTDITDLMVIASGNSDRHVKSIADRVLQRCREAGFRPYGLEGERDGEWVLLDLQDVVLHVMLPRVRQFYALEKLWEGGAAA